MSTSGAIKAGRAFVELFADDNKLYRALDRASAKLKATGAMWAKIGAGVSFAGATAAAPLLKLAGDAASRGADIKTLSDRFNLTTQSVSALAYAFESVGSPFEEFAGTLDSLGAKLASAADGNDELFRRLHLNARAMIDLPLDKQLDMIADAFSRITNPIDRANVASELFGGSGAKLLPVLAKGAAGLKALKDEASELGFVLDPESATRGQDAMRGLTASWLAFKSVLLEVGAATLPTSQEIRSMVAVVRQVAGGVRAWVKENRQAIVTVAIIAAGLVAAGATLTAFWAIISSVGAAVGAAVIVFKALVATVALLANPVGLATAALVIFISQTEAGSKAASYFDEMLTGLKETAVSTFEGIVAALKKGDLELAFKVAGAGIRTIWAELMLSLRKGWNDFVKWLVGFLKNNPWVLPAIGAAVGFAVGGPGGALAGAGAGAAGALGVATFSDEIVNGLSVDLTDATAAVARAKAELAGLVAKAKEPLPVVPGGGAGTGEQPKYVPGLPKPPPLYGAVKGVFSGPIAQQLAYGDQVQKRQLDAQLAIKAAVEGVGKAIAGIPFAKFK